MRRICTGLGRGRRLSTPRPTQIYTLFYALRAVVFACKCGVSPYRDNKTVRIPDKSKFSGRSSRTQRVYTNLGSPANGFGLRNSNRYSGQSGGLSLQGFRWPFVSPINQNLADDRAEMQKICIDLVGAHYVRPRTNAVRPYGHCVTVYVSAKSKFTVRSGISPPKQKTVHHCGRVINQNKIKLFSKFLKRGSGGKSSRKKISPRSLPFAPQSTRASASMSSSVVDQLVARRMTV